MNAAQISDIFLASVKEGVGDLWEASVESEAFFLLVASEFATETLALRAAVTPLQRALHEANLKHLRAQVFVRLGALEIAADRKARETAWRVLKAVMTALVATVA